MKKLRKLIILDDDPHYSGMLALRLRMRFPELMISSSERTQVPAGYDIYVLDNDFAGDKCGAALAEQVAAVAPDSLVVVLSGTLEFDLLKRLVNCHAAGVFDKSKETELDAMIALMERFLLEAPAPEEARQQSSFGATMGGIRDLIGEWNRRLAYENERVS